MSKKVVEHEVGCGWLVLVFIVLMFLSEMG